MLVNSRLWARRALGPKPNFTQDPSCMWASCTLNLGRGFETQFHGITAMYMERCALNSTMVKLSPTVVLRNYGEVVPTYVSSSLSDRGSKLQGQPQNSPMFLQR
ncbi:hypothetical protein AVEN_202479-1 [Araneus ventricosus]|uniref:Uncharacterized protein n=1 Tax=Araneus ventricosus TaxID=182803 RepID=A0A4Y2JMQ3_ARAVE|nr:hypothetical protein AVEN_202479-1 [Araneus ventricosus]